jgi:antirestriction protein ArdC
MENQQQEKIRKTLDGIIQLFQTGNVPQAISIAMFPQNDVPSANWSLSNRIIMAINGTSDARGFQQWKQAGRNVKAGEKAFHILAPKMIKKKTKTDANQDQKDEFMCIGFLTIPVFKVEQTEGKPVQYEKLVLPNLPLLAKALEWHIDVIPVSAHGEWRGAYSYNELGIENIKLATPHEKTFFHELSHAAHKRVLGELKKCQDPKQEIVAELAAQTLSQLVGIETESSLGNSYEYIKEYSEKIGKDVGKACLSVLSEVEKILTLILE